MGAARLTRLSGSTRRHPAVPVGQVEDMSVGGPVHLLKILVMPRIQRSVRITAARHGTEIEGQCMLRTETLKWMMESGRVQSPPLPSCRVLSQQLLRSIHGSREGIAKQCVAARRRIRTEPGDGGILQLLQNDLHAAEVPSILSLLHPRVECVHGCQQLLHPDRIQRSRLRRLRQVAVPAR